MMVLSIILLLVSSVCSLLSLDCVLMTTRKQIMALFSAASHLLNGKNRVCHENLRDREEFPRLII